MRNPVVLTHKFVEFMPRDLEPNTIYVSIPYATAIHNCCCGCGNRVVTPISPNDWTLIFDGRSISLEPSIGNWSFPCRSHYFIRKNRVVWAETWSEERVLSARRKQEHPEQTAPEAGKTPTPEVAATPTKRRGGLKRRIKCWFGSKGTT